MLQCENFELQDIEAYLSTVSEISTCEIAMYQKNAFHTMIDIHLMSDPLTQQIICSHDAGLGNRHCQHKIKIHRANLN
jgi:hypothetical protein